MTNAKEKKSGLGMFGGVYTPSILTILGVIMYLRFGWVVGNAGLLGTLAIVTLANVITFLTALSICAIATDKVVRVGGAYYMISRSLGLETGGAVGIPLYFAQAFSVALYTIGFAESVVRVFPNLSQLYVALIVTVLVGILAITSASIAIKAQYFIMAAIALSLISFFFGKPMAEAGDIAMWGSTAETPIPFWTVFAVFFPAVTGIMSGVNMSGDLKDPIKSIPFGTLAAVATGYLIYMIIPLFLFQRGNTASLINDPLVMQKISLWAPAILLGVWGATLSSAIGSILGAPRVLQALARDGVLPSWLGFLGSGSGRDDEPRIGTIVTLGVAIAAVCIGDLNLIAPVLTMFFLTTYFVLNVSAGIETFLQSPSFRPTFRVHWALSLLGALGCLGVMFLINAIATIVAALIVLCIYIWLQRRELETAWGDVRRGLWMALISKAIYQVLGTDDSKNWRPHILVLSGTPRKRWSLIELADTFSHNRALMTVASILPAGSRDAGQQVKLETTIRDYISKRGIRALVRVSTAEEPFTGAMNLIETYGLGDLIPNTILLGASESPERLEPYCNLIKNIHIAERNVVIFRENPELVFGKRRRIDIWWGGVQTNGGLMLMLAYLLRTDIEWRNAQIYLKLVVHDEAGAQAARQNLEDLITTSRIKAEPIVIVAGDRPFDQILHESSTHADLVFLGMARPTEHPDFFHYYTTLQERMQRLPSTVFVLAAPNYAFAEVIGSNRNST
ncbi:amino acid permease [[Leptolyngbya] sp. PCC 7376]|uniref:amino acid permease n=1 Tax=[Leptolyngbya] sp. PCC 7376 TaxID=111781 RepID=UPI0006861E22|nr:amino acid permease [[Leptolyngbya] sp. PCC 7376]